MTDEIKNNPYQEDYKVLNDKDEPIDDIFAFLDDPTLGKKEDNKPEIASGINRIEIELSDEQQSQFQELLQHKYFDKTVSDIFMAGICLSKIDANLDYGRSLVHRINNERLSIDDRLCIFKEIGAGYTPTIFGKEKDELANILFSSAVKLGLLRASESKKWSFESLKFLSKECHEASNEKIDNIKLITLNPSYDSREVISRLICASSERPECFAKYMYGFKCECCCHRYDCKISYVESNIDIGRPGCYGDYDENRDECAYCDDHRRNCVTRKVTLNNNI
jgi:hypothetical protein